MKPRVVHAPGKGGKGVPTFSHAWYYCQGWGGHAWYYISKGGASCATRHVATRGTRYPMGGARCATFSHAWHERAERAACGHAWH